LTKIQISSPNFNTFSPYGQQNFYLLLDFGAMIGYYKNIRVSSSHTEIWSFFQGDNQMNTKLISLCSSNELRFWSNNWNVGSGFSVKKGEWYHVANVYDGKTASVYMVVLIIL